MKEVTKIMIEGASGFGPIEEGYNDKLIIGQAFIEYLYQPAQESPLNPLRKWRYTTNSPIYKKLFNEVVSLLSIVYETDPDQVFCTDVGGYTFNIKYSDGSKLKKTFWTGGSIFAQLFHCISRMVPDTEYMPALLLLGTSDVYIASFVENGKTKWGLFYEDDNGDKKAFTQDFKPLVFDTYADARSMLEAIEAERDREMSAEPYTIPEARFFAESHNWKFAKTYAKTAPHEYLVKRWLSEEDQRGFERFVQTINEHAVRGYFYGHPNNYLILRDYYYWFMDGPGNMAVDLINRNTVDKLELRDGVYYYRER